MHIASLKQQIANDSMINDSRLREWQIQMNSRDGRIRELI